MRLPSPEEFLLLIVFFPLFMIAVMAHEVAHGIAALREGDPTAKYAGRLTFNPMDHLDPVGTFVFIATSLMGIGFGWAKPVPINPVLFKNYRGGIIRVSLAGVAANLALVIIGSIVFKILLVTGIVNPYLHGGYSFYVSQLLIRFMLFNLILFVFNLIPIPPLDGSKVLMMVLPRETAIAYKQITPYGMFIIFGLIAMGLIDKIFMPFFHVFEMYLNFLINL